MRKHTLFNVPVSFSILVSENAELDGPIMFDGTLDEDLAEEARQQQVEYENMLMGLYHDPAPAVMVWNRDTDGNYIDEAPVGPAEGACSGCTYATGEYALPCAVDPLSFGKGCREYSN